ncbi:MAG: VWA domain-containing protein [Acidobacteriota bacterium]
MKRLLPTLLLAILLGTGAAVAQPGQSLSLGHARQVSDRPTTVRVYLDVLDDEGKPVENVSADQLQATLGGDQTDVASVEPFDDTGEGVGYIFLVDISKSLSEREFDRIRQALELWFEDLRETDRAAIIAFGDYSRLVVDFTSDPQALREGLAGLGPTDDQTLLHRAMVDALAIGRQRDREIPGRPVLVVLTDGKDEGSGLLADDVLERLRTDPMPIYAIGVSKQPAGERERYLGVLHRLASNSGGAFIDGGERFEDGYRAARDAIRRVWVAEVSCPDCQLDGENRRLQIRLQQGHRLLSQGTDVRLLPTPTAGDRPATEGEAPAVDVDSADQRSADEEPEAPAVGTGDRFADQAPGEEAGEAGTVAARGVGGRGVGAPWWRQPLLWLALLALALLIWLLLRMRRRPAPEGTEGDANASGGVTLPPVTVPDTSEFEAMQGERLVDPRSVRFVVLRGSRKGREYRVLLRDRAVVGARSTCDLVLTDEADIAPEQFELTQVAKDVFLRNLSERSPTLVNGLASTDGHVLKSNDLVGTRETILRAVIF